MVVFDFGGMVVLVGKDGMVVCNGGVFSFGFVFWVDDEVFLLVVGCVLFGLGEVVVELIILDKFGLKVGDCIWFVVVGIV